MESPYVALVPASTESRVAALELQVQELRQALVFLLNPFTSMAVNINNPVAEDHSTRLSSYPKVEA